MKQYEKFLMQQNEVYTLYKNYTSDIMQALKEKIDENRPSKYTMVKDGNEKRRFKDFR